MSMRPDRFTGPGSFALPTLAGLLARLGVTDAPEPEQRAAVRAAVTAGRFFPVELTTLDEAGWLTSGPADETDRPIAPPGLWETPEQLATYPGQRLIIRGAVWDLGRAASVDVPGSSSEVSSCNTRDTR